jgi:hypothetical protein
MGLFELLIVGGATACAALGAGTVLAFGSWQRRATLLPPLALAGLWWFFAVARAGISGAACPNCPPPAFDPWAYAYSAPQLTLMTLILPALAIAVLAMTIPASQPETTGYISPS